MTENAAAFFRQTFINPVYPHSFPDPFVLKFRGEYFAYCTGLWKDGKVFGVLRSRDLVNWTEIGGAMNRLKTDAPFYWAPEVTYADGKFYLYYSVGNEVLMEIRVAVSDRPDGGFVDAGVKLTSEDFAIDAHVFTDDSGERYFFYAVDFLEHSHIGTGTVVDKMKNFFALEGSPRPVTRARYDWQVYDPKRMEKGGARWHTVEGAFVLKRKGVYYEMFSGGNWQNPTYGVSFAVTDDIEKNEEWLQFSDGERVLPILRTIPEKVVGPGHNSVIRGVNNRELFCVYHRWTEGGRTMAIDRMDFAGARIFIKGATFTTQIAPFAPNFADFFDSELSKNKWQSDGEWEISGGEVLNKTAENSRLICHYKADSFLCEFSFRAAEFVDEESAFGFCLLNEEVKTCEFTIFPKLRQVRVFYLQNGEFQKRIFDLPESFTAEAVHLARVEVDNFSVKISLDDAVVRFGNLIENRSAQIALAAENMRAAFSGFALTEGFEDLFEWSEAESSRRGWKKLNPETICRVENGELMLSSRNKKDAVLIKGEARADFEFAANVRLIETYDDDFSFGLLLLNQDEDIISRFSVCKTKAKYYLTAENDSLNFPLPENFSPENYHQFRIFKYGEKIFLQMDGTELGEIAAPYEEIKTALFCRRSTVAFEMARLTVL
jgi:GH43 family beta-xylosidase